MPRSRVVRREGIFNLWQQKNSTGCGRRIIEAKVVKMKLNAFCTSPAFKEDLDSAALGITPTAIEASRFLNFWVIEILDRGGDISKMDQTFFYSAFILMARITRKENSLGIFGAALHEYDRQRPAGLERFDPAIISQILNKAGRDYLTACQNCTLLNMTSQARKAFWIFLDNLDGNGDMRAPNKHKLYNHYMRRMSQETGGWELWTRLRYGILFVMSWRTK